MVTNAMLPKQFRMKFLSQFRKIVIGTRREIHYIGGSEVLPAHWRWKRRAQSSRNWQQNIMKKQKRC